MHDEGGGKAAFASEGGQDLTNILRSRIEGDAPESSSSAYHNGGAVTTDAIPAVVAPDPPLQRHPPAKLTAAATLALEIARSPWNMTGSPRNTPNQV